MAYSNHRGTPEDRGYKNTGVNEDTAMSAVEFGRTALNFAPGGKVIHSIATVGDVALAGVGGDIEAEKDNKRLAAAGININDERIKWNPAVRSRLEKLQQRWSGRMGEAVVSAGTGIAGGWAGSALAGAALGSSVAPGVGTVVGLVGGGVGAVGAGYLGSKVYSKFVPLDEQDEVDLTIKMVEAQKNGMEIPKEVVFAQWAAQQKGVLDQKLKAELYAKTGLTNFNDAVEQGKLQELNTMMNKLEYKNTMAANMGILPDSQNPDKHVAEELAEWVNSGQLPAKDLLLKSQMPLMSLADAQREGYANDPLVMPSVPLDQTRGRASPDYTMAV